MLSDLDLSGLLSGAREAFAYPVEEGIPGLLGASSWLMLAHVGSFFAFFRIFFDFLVHLKLSCICVSFFCDFS